MQSVSVFKPSQSRFLLWDNGLTHYLPKSPARSVAARRPLRRCWLLRRYRGDALGTKTMTCVRLWCARRVSGLIVSAHFYLRSEVRSSLSGKWTRCFYVGLLSKRLRANASFKPTQLKRSLMCMTANLIFLNPFCIKTKKIRLAAESGALNFGSEQKPWHTYDMITDSRLPQHIASC